MMDFLLLCLPFSFLLFTPSSSQALAPAGPVGTIERTTKQQIITSIPPSLTGIGTEPFLTSPSGKYVAYFIRAKTVLGAGGFGNDFCYIQIRDYSTGEAVWESECAPVSTMNTCTLAFSDDGLAVYDGSTLQWDNSAESADNNPIETLELVDEGDMRLRDKIGELAWRASEDPRVNQRCGEPGSPGLAPAMPPFAMPIGGENMPFGQQGGTGLGGRQVTPADEASGTLPLAYNSPFDSGSLRVMEALCGMAVALLVALLVYSFGY